MTGTAIGTTHGTVRLPDENVAWRTMRIRATREQIKTALKNAMIPGEVTLKEAPGDRGIDVSVELQKEDNKEAEHRLSPYEGGSVDEQLESALWTLKAKLETGEVATTEGQSSGRSR